jgi:predicted ATP-grasp superfamily ATP-dependent carboligase
VAVGRVRRRRARLQPFRFVTRRGSGTVRVSGRPRLSHPSVVVAFEGWNDAADAASYAVTSLARAWQAAPFAEIDPEEFFDFTEARPELTVLEGLVREITWPATVFSVAPGPVDVVVVRGPEPQLRWRAYCEAFVELATALRAGRVVLLGAYLAEVTHSRPVPLAATASDAAAIGEVGFALSRYEGPTGIVGVLGAALAEAGVPAVAIWASVPCYSLPVSAKAALALAEAASRIVGRPADLPDLAHEAHEYERRMDELVVEDETVAAYVARIVAHEDLAEPGPSVEGLTEEIERYLRDEPR